MRRRLTRLIGLIRLVIALGTLCVALPATAQELKVTLAVMGFTADQKQMLVQVEDDTIGTNLRLYDVATGQPAKKSQLIPFQRGESQKIIKDTRKKLKMVDPGIEDTLYPLDPADPDNNLSFFGLMASRERFVLAVTDRQKLGKIADIPVRRDEDAGVWAKASLKSLVWTSDRKQVVAVVTQKLTGDGLHKEIDEVHAFTFKVKDIRWVEPEPAPPAGDAPKPAAAKPPEASQWTHRLRG